MINLLIRRVKMLIMDIINWEPDKSEAIIKHRAQEKIPEGVKVLGEWVSIGGCRAYRLVEVADPRLLFAMTSAWVGYGKKELVPVMATEEMMKLMQGAR
jgi:hypothetical protein